MTPPVKLFQTCTYLSLSLFKRCSKHLSHSLSRVIKRGNRQSFEYVIARYTNITGIDFFSLSLFRFHYSNFSLSPFSLAVAPNLVLAEERSVWTWCTADATIGLLDETIEEDPSVRNALEEWTPRIPYEIMHVCQLNGIQRVRYKDENNGAGWNVERKGAEKGPRALLRKLNDASQFRNKRSSPLESSKTFRREKMNFHIERSMRRKRSNCVVSLFFHDL